MRVGFKELYRWSYLQNVSLIKKKLQTAYEAGGEAVADRGRGLIELETII